MMFSVAKIFLISVFCNLFYLNLVNTQRVKLSDIESLTFHKDRLTTGRRLRPVSQLKCDSKLRLISYSNCYKFQPSVVQCYNRGHDSQTVRWECKADLDKLVKFSVLKVSCEGYDYKNDPYVLFGSCGLEYSLEIKPSKNFNEYYHTRDLYETNKLSNFLTLLIMIVIVLAIYKSCSKNHETEHQRQDINNGTFAQVINGTDINTQNSSRGLFPPPPPPYGFSDNNTDRNDDSKPEYNVSVSNSPFFVQPIQNPVNEIINNNPSEEIIVPNSWNSPVGADYIFNRRERNESPPPAYDAASPVVITNDLPNLDSNKDIAISENKK